MENIIEPTENFNFESVNLAQPLPLQGGNFYTKITHGNNKLPLYLQLPNCKTRNGIIKGNLSSRKSYCDLLFNTHQTELISWFEKFENKCMEMIYQKRDSWFQNEMTIDDIENIFISSMKPFRSGKYIMIRTHIPNTKQLKKEHCMVYDENEQLLDWNELNDNSEVIPLIQINGIRFSSKSFQMDISLPQLMVIRIQDTVKNEFMIKNEKTGHESKSLALKKESGTVGDDIPHINDETDKGIDKNEIEKDVKNEMENNINNNDTLRVSHSENTAVENTAVENTAVENTAVEKELNDNKNIVNDENKEINTLEKSSNLLGMEEINLELDENNEKNETISLKNPNEIYLGIYKVAKEKARHMRKAAIEAYLEAKNIKSRYFLEDELNSSDDNLSNFSVEEENGNSI